MKRWAHLREILIETGSNLMIATERRNPQPYITPIGLHRVVVTLDALLFHFMSHSSVQR